MERIENGDIIMDKYDSYKDGCFTVEYRIEKEYRCTPWVYYKLTYWDEKLKKYITEDNQELEYEEVQSLYEAEEKFIEMLEDNYGNTKKENNK